MKRDYFPAAIGSLSCSILGIICVVLLFIIAMEWINVLMIISLIFFGLAVLTGGYSLFIKNNKPAWVGLIVGLLFILLFIIIGLLLRDMCVIC